jgi:hypothetical protein
VPAQLALWRIGNIRAAEAAGEHLRESYLRLRYEDLCLRPMETVSALFRFLGAPAARAREAAGTIRPSPGIGRWRSEDRAEFSDPDPALREALTRFGYPLD